MMFILSIPEDYTPKRKKVFKDYDKINTSYPTTDMEKLSVFRCPNCKEHQLFRGLVFIGCAGCICWFSEEDIILENMIGE